MNARITDQKSSDTKYNARFVERFPIDLAAEEIDLYDWIVDMTESDYRSYSPAHLAMNSFVKDGVLFMTNVENIGADTVVQHYELKHHDAHHIQLYSAKSDAYIWRWLRVNVGVPWEMQIRSTSSQTSELVCLVGADYPTLLLKVAAFLNGLGGTFLSKHLRREGKAFAKDIEEKFGPGINSGI